MVGKPYQWPDGAKLEDHSRRKHKILREYFSTYLNIRCQLPQQERFRLAVVDGFAGAGRYTDGASGSPLIFIEELRRGSDSVNAAREAQGLPAIEIDALLVFNDAAPGVIDLLKANVAPLHAEIKVGQAKLHLEIVYLNEPFESAYPKIKAKLQSERYRNVLFNLDQCGHSDVERSTLMDIMQSHTSAEIFYTFAISALVAFLSKSNPTKLAAQLRPLQLDGRDLEALNGVMSRQTWLGVAERLVADTFGRCAQFVSPFSINNPEGWRYWLIHFSNSYRGRQVYNSILHANSSAQAHFGRSGLHMLSYDPSDDANSLYLFDDQGRHAARGQLIEDIPRLIAESGDVMGVGEFYQGIYNSTPAHVDDVHEAIILNPDIEIITPAGGERRKANTIRVDDVLKLKDQKSFFQMFRATLGKRP
jgi:three-Cys-motif partner protein